MSTACWVLLWLVFLGFIAFPCRFPSCLEENDPDPKSGRELDPDLPVWSTSCLEDVTDPSFSHSFGGVSSPIP